jgi:hypothetical protein
MRHVLVVLFVSLSPILVTQGWRHPAPPADSSPKIEVRLIPEKSVIRHGETLRFKLEIWNVGADDILIAQKVDAKSGIQSCDSFSKQAQSAKPPEG